MIDQPLAFVAALARAAGGVARGEGGVAALTLAARGAFLTVIDVTSRGAVGAIASLIFLRRTQAI